MTFRPLPRLNGTRLVLRLLMALALALLTLAGSHAGMIGCDPAETVQAAQTGGHGHAHGGHAMASAQTAHHAPDAPAAPAAHKTCSLASCPLCLWQAAAEPGLPRPSLWVVLPPPAEPPAPPGLAPSPAFDPPRSAA